MEPDTDEINVHDAFIFLHSIDAEDINVIILDNVCLLEMIHVPVTSYAKLKDFY